MEALGILITKQFFFSFLEVKLGKFEDVKI